MIINSFVSKFRLLLLLLLLPLFLLQLVVFSLDFLVLSSKRLIFLLKPMQIPTQPLQFLLKQQLLLPRHPIHPLPILLPKLQLPLSHLEHPAQLIHDVHKLDHQFRRPKPFSTLISNQGSQSIDLPEVNIAIVEVYVGFELLLLEGLSFESEDFIVSELQLEVVLFD